MREIILLLAILYSTAVSAQQFDFSLDGGVNITSKQNTSALNETAKPGSAIVVKAIKTGGVLYFGASVGIYKLSTGYSTSYTDSNSTVVGPYDVKMIYGAPSIEFNLLLGKRFNFGDNTIHTGITAGAAINKSDGTPAFDKMYSGNYKPLLFGLDIGYTRYFNMIGIGIAVNPHIASSVHNKNLSLLVVPVTLGIHLHI